MNDSHHPHRTSPELKWLLNERAALLGRIKKAQERAESFDIKIRLYEQLIARAARHRAAAELDVAAKSKTIAALDVSIALVDARIRPDAAGCVVPWKDKYGARGGLSSFIRETLRLAAPEPISGPELTRLAAAHFNLTLLTPPERRSFRYSVKTALHVAIQRDGVVERLPKSDARFTLFRWKAPARLDSLRTALAELEESEHGQTADPV